MSPQECGKNNDMESHSRDCGVTVGALQIRVGSDVYYSTRSNFLRDDNASILEPSGKDPH